MSDFDFKLRQNKKVRRLILAVRFDGSVAVTAPVRLSKNFIKKFVERHRDWIEEKQKILVKKKINYSQNKVGNFSKNKKVARELILARLNYFNQFYNFKWQKIFIKNQRTVWGSCSRRNNLNFNYKILFLPKALADYVIVHELCHLGELNHSTKFWLLVEKTTPEYRQLKKELWKIIL